MAALSQPGSCAPRRPRRPGVGHSGSGGGSSDSSRDGWGWAGHSVPYRARAQQTRGAWAEQGGLPEEASSVYTCISQGSATLSLPVSELGYAGIPRRTLSQALLSGSSSRSMGDEGN